MLENYFLVFVFFKCLCKYTFCCVYEALDVFFFLVLYCTHMFNKGSHVLKPQAPSLLNNNLQLTFFLTKAMICTHILHLYFPCDSISVPSRCCIYHGANYVFEKQLTLLDLSSSEWDLLLLRTGPSVHLHQQTAKAHAHRISR